MDAALERIKLADAFVELIATSRLWTCVGCRCQTVTADTGPRTWHRSHRCDSREYVAFGDFKGHFKAYSLAPWLGKMQQEQPSDSVRFYTWLWVARLAVDFCAASQAAAEGARVASGPQAPLARRICECCDRCSCVVVYPMHPPPCRPRLCRPTRVATQAGGAGREAHCIHFRRMEGERSLGAVARPESLMVAPSRLLSIVHVLG